MENLSKYNSSCAYGLLSLSTLLCLLKKELLHLSSSSDPYGLIFLA